MQCAGFVLAGGQSRRMGQDKALLQLGGLPLVEWGLRSLRPACVQVAIAGGDRRLASFGTVVQDDLPGRGPLGGIVSALLQSTWEWNLFLAVDVPFVPPAVWHALLACAASSEAVCVMARGAYVQPLVAAYRKSAAGALRQALSSGQGKVVSAIASAGPVAYVDFRDEHWFQNVNTPAEFSALAASNTGIDTGSHTG